MRKALTILVATVALSACAGLREVSNDVSTYSLWPAGRPATTYVFERLPSQQANNGTQQQMLEEAAHGAMERAGFKLAADPQQADVTVTLGARVTETDISPYDSPFWWHGGLWGHRHLGRPFGRGYGVGFGYGFPYAYDTLKYEREVAMLIRDRKSGQPLYEVRVTNDGYSPSMTSLLGAMFEAGMRDFPNGGANPRRVVTQISSSS